MSSNDDVPTHCPGCGDRVTVFAECPRTVATAPVATPVPNPKCYDYEMVRRWGLGNV